MTNGNYREKPEYLIKFWKLKLLSWYYANLSHHVLALSCLSSYFHSIVALSLTEKKEQMCFFTKAGEVFIAHQVCLSTKLDAVDNGNMAKSEQKSKITV